MLLYLLLRRWWLLHSWLLLLRMLHFLALRRLLFESGLLPALLRGLLLYLLLRWRLLHFRLLVRVLLYLLLRLLPESGLLPGLLRGLLLYLLRRWRLLLQFRLLLLPTLLHPLLLSNSGLRVRLLGRMLLYLLLWRLLLYLLLRLALLAISLARLLRSRLYLLGILLRRYTRLPVRPGLLWSSADRRALRRWNFLGDHLSAHHRFRGLHGRSCSRAHHASAIRSHLQGALHFRPLHLLRIDSHRGAANGTRIHERVVRNGGHGCDVALVHVSHIIDVHIVVNVGDIHDVHRRVSHVDPLHIPLA